MKLILSLATLTLGVTLMSQLAFATPDAATDQRIDPQIRSFLAKLNKDSSPFWELAQPKPQQILTGLQGETPVEMSGVTVTEQSISQDGRTVRLYVMKPEQVSGDPGVLLFIHGGVWIVGNFENHKRLLRDLVVGSGQVGVFVEYTPLPQAKFPTQLEECYAALKWVAAHAGELGADASRIAVAGNSVGGNMTAALSLMSKDRNGPKISYQVLLIPATDASVDTDSYHEYGTDRFLARAFMKYGWTSTPLMRRPATIRTYRRCAPASISSRASRPRSSSRRRMIRCATRARPMPASSSRRASSSTRFATTARFTISCC
jgi:acetyl esterase